MAFGVAEYGLFGKGAGLFGLGKIIGFVDTLF